MSEHTQPVIVGIDGSDAALAAARWAASVAEKFEAPLELVSAKPGTGRLLTDAASAIWAAVIAEHCENATAVLKQAEEELRAKFRGLQVTTLRSDEPVDSLLAARSRAAQLLVLGSEEISPPGALLVGSTTMAVAARAACPVVAWRGTSEATTERPVVLGVDRIRTQAAAFRAAFEFADRVGVAVKAVHACSTVRPPIDIPNLLMIDWDGIEALQWQELLNMVEPWTELYPDVPVTYFVEPESAGRALIRHSAGSQLVVVGGRAGNSLPAALLGSASLNLLHHSSVPVMLCHNISGAKHS